jgi:hypothetical protein
MEFVNQFDWGSEMKKWEQERAIILNPIIALVGRLENCAINLSTILQHKAASCCPFGLE